MNKTKILNSKPSRLGPKPTAAILQPQNQSCLNIPATFRTLRLPRKNACASDINSVLSGGIKKTVRKKSYTRETKIQALRVLKTQRLDENGNWNFISTHGKCSINFTSLLCLYFGKIANFDRVKL